MVSPYGCSVWKGISARWPDFSRDLSFTIGDGKSVYFWKDRWAGSSPLALVFPSLFSKARSKDDSVFDM